MSVLVRPSPKTGVAGMSTVGNDVACPGTGGLPFLPTWGEKQVGWSARPAMQMRDKGIWICWPPARRKMRRTLAKRG